MSATVSVTCQVRHQQGCLLTLTCADRFPWTQHVQHFLVHLHSIDHVTHGLLANSTVFNAKTLQQCLKSDLMLYTMRQQRLTTGRPA